MAKQTTAAASKNTEPKDDVRNPTLDKGMPNFDEWSEEQIGFAPYWKPEVGKWFYGAPVAIDMRDPKFVRFQFIAYADTPCQRGPSDEENENSEQVIVPKGGTFSLSVYYSLRDVFEEYLRYGAESGKPVPVRVDALRTVPTKNQPKCWQFQARVAKDVKAALTAWRAKNVKVLPPAAERPAMEE